MTLFEKKERARTNLKVFFYSGIIFVVINLFISIMTIILLLPPDVKDMFRSSFGELPLLALIISGIIAIPVGLFLGVCVFGSVALSVYMMFKKYGMLFLFLIIFTAGSALIITIMAGYIISPIIVIRDIYYLKWAK